MIWKIILGSLAVVIAVMYQNEVDDDILITEKGVALAATRAKVFMYISDMTKMKDWFPGIVRFEPVDSLPMDIGKHFLEVDLTPLTGESFHDNVITGYESPKYIGYVSDTLLQTRVEITVERIEGESSHPTRLKYKLYSRRRNLFIKYVVAPVLSYYTGPYARTAMFNLKHHFQK